MVCRQHLASGYALQGRILISGVAIILPEIQVEFGIAPSRIALMTVSLYMGLIFGATGWGLMADVIGRRLAFNLTLLIAGIFGTAAGGAPSFGALGTLIAFIGLGVGGNLPVDSALFLEFVPASHQWLLTILSAFWAIGQLVASLVAWPLIVNFSCPSGTSIPAGTCTKSENMGWRYAFITLGGLTLLMFVARYVIFTLYESPKFLLAKGRDQEAIDVIQKIAKQNRRQCTLTLADLQAVDARYPDAEKHSTKRGTALLRENLSKFDVSHIKALFSSRKMAISTSLIILLWALIGLAYPLYNAFLPIYLNQRSSTLNETYRNYSIISACGIPGSLLGGYLVELPRFGRKGTMSLATLLTGIFLFLFTTASNNSAVLGWNCATALTQNLMYAVLYHYTPEVFPAPHRGTGNGLCSCANRVFGILAPIVTVGGALTTSVPIFVSASLFIVAGIIMIFLPFESRGKANL